MDFSMNLDEIDELAKLITSSVATLKDLKDRNADENEDDKRQDEVDASKMRIACSCITSAAAQLMTLVRSPEQVVFDMAMSFHLPSALRLVIESHVPEILRAKNDGAGAHVDDISKINGVNAQKLGHVLRLLATHYVFDEAEPNVFANNRLSESIDTGVSLEGVLSRPLEKYDSKNGGFAALVAVTTHESMRNGLFMTDALTDPTLTDSFMPEDSPFSLAMWPGSTCFGVADQVVKRLDMFEWMNTALENRWRLTRFGNAMEGVSRLTPPDAILKGFRWSDLSSDSVVVDVGGGIGSASLPIVVHTPVKLIIQDRGIVLEDATKYWQEHCPNALESGRVTFVDHDFFEPQPSTACDGHPTVFLLRMIMHNWADEHAKIILKHIRDAAKDTTKLVIVDGLLESACRTPAAEEVQGQKKGSKPPQPLLSNWGAANGMAYKFDIQMLCNHNAGERTLDEFDRLLAETGWRIVEVYQSQQSWMPQIVAIPNGS
ncbi:S-adenosyl-L-methionine-dependent methyltransferase [Schizopora paradoxa]|uniref:S-adenosyl-L-methionine-dependent methyltransferase n=1 Tax=Schizopora paradoxa TaxID=27342 RepID=A0A0H2RKJ1_9AGAM|nr:S-adenosyl-L-methionine-dependent methyltransferase [Schizopora paradoxa]